MVFAMSAADRYSASAYPEDAQRTRQPSEPPERESGQAGQEDREAHRAMAALLWAVGVAALFTLYLRIKVSATPSSDTASNALQAWDMLHGHLLLHGWILGDVTYYTFELPLMAVVEIFFGLHTMAVHVAMALVYLIVTSCAVVVAVTDSRGASRAARAGIVVAMLTPPVLVASDLWIPLGFPDHFGTAVFLLVPFLLIDRAASRWFTAPLVCLILCAGQIGDVTVRYVAVPAILLVCAYRVLAVRKIRTGDAANLLAAALSLPLATGVRALMRHSGSYVMVAPRTQVAPFSEWASNWALTWHSVRMLFGISGEPGTGQVGAAAIFGWACLVVVAAGMLRVIWRWRRARRAEQLLVLVIVLNLVVYAFSTLPTPKTPHDIAAVLPAGAILGARVLVPARIPGRWMAMAATGAALVAALLPLSLVAANRPPIVPRWTRLAAWLQAHGLRYGLGGYWDSSVVTLLSGGQVQVRPVVLRGREVTLRPWESSTLWYDPAMHSANFIITGSPRTGLDSRADRFFGAPASVYRLGEWDVLVYHKNLLDELKPPALPPLS
jgi:hypothetical protein